MRIGLCEDTKLAKLLELALPNILGFLSSAEPAVRNKVMAILGHINKRVKGDASILLPLGGLAKLFLSTDHPMVSNFALVYVEMAFARVPAAERATLLPKLLVGMAARQVAQQDTLLQLLLLALPTLPLPKVAAELKGSEASLPFLEVAADRSLALRHLLDVLLYLPPCTRGQAEGAPPPAPPGLSHAAAKRVCGKLGPEEVRGELLHGQLTTCFQRSTIYYLLPGARRAARRQEALRAAAARLRSRHQPALRASGGAAPLDRRELRCRRQGGAQRRHRAQAAPEGGGARGHARGQTHTTCACACAYACACTRAWAPRLHHICAGGPRRDARCAHEPRARRRGGRRRAHRRQHRRASQGGADARPLCRSSGPLPRHAAGGLSLPLRRRRHAQAHAGGRAAGQAPGRALPRRAAGHHRPPAPLGARQGAPPREPAQRASAGAARGRIDARLQLRRRRDALRARARAAALGPRAGDDVPPCNPV